MNDDEITRVVRAECYRDAKKVASYGMLFSLSVHSILLLRMFMPWNISVGIFGMAFCFIMAVRTCKVSYWAFPTAKARRRISRRSKA